MRFAVLSTIVVLCACSRASIPPEPAPVVLPTPTPRVPAPSPTSVLEPGAWRDPAAPPSRVSAPTVAAMEPPLPAASPVRVRVVRSTDTTGEDGHGNVVAAPWPVAIELECEAGFAAGAQGTTLHVGSLQFYNVGYPSLRVARFIVADGRTLAAHTPVSLQYGAMQPRVLATALQVPP